MCSTYLMDSTNSILNTPEYKGVELEYKAQLMKYPLIPTLKQLEAVSRARAVGVDPLSDSAYELVETLIKMLEAPYTKGKLSQSNKIAYTINTLSHLLGYEPEE